MKLSLIAILFSITAWAIIPAKEAAKKSQENKARLQEQDRQSRVKCMKAWEQEINARIEDAIEKGLCQSTQSTECFWSETTDREALQEKFKKAGYKINRDLAHNTDPYYFIISWCDEK
jgi:hypothetical protein